MPYMGLITTGILSGFKVEMLNLRLTRLNIKNKNHGT